MHERLIELLKTALAFHVSDIHFSITSERITIEMRIKGEMRTMKAREDDLQLFRYILYRSNVDISNVFEPQTGRFAETIDGKIISLRFAVVTSHGLTGAVLRILNDHGVLDFEDLSKDSDTISFLKDITSHHSGLFIFSGPTGSGKTTSLYTILNHTKGKKIYSLEDPVEVVQEGFVQLQINEKQLTYEEGIKQLMRQDPDIIMIGEIRDTSAAVNALRCALTGHLVVTSLHSYDCISAIHRMIDLGVREYQLKDVLNGITNQRLFEDDQGRKTGVYEIMSRKEILYYFEHREQMKGHRSLKDNLKKAYEDGIVTENQYEEESVL